MKQLTWNRAILILVVLIAFGCGGSTATMKQTVMPSPTPNVKFIPTDNTIYITGIKKVAVFPFADYSHQQDTIRPDAWGGNIKIQEEILDQLVGHGLSVAVQEDVNTLLVDHDIIRPIDQNYLIQGTVNNTKSNNPLDNVASPEYTLVNHTYTEVMRDDIRDLIDKSNRQKTNKRSTSPVLQGCTVGLTKEKVTELADALDVDLIIRGRILDYGIKETASSKFRDSGVVPVVFRGGRNILLGGGGSFDDGVEKKSQGIVPSIFGSARGFMLGGSDASGYDTDLGTLNSLTVGTVGGALINGTTGALAGAGIGYLVSQQPERSKRAAVMQVRIYAQNGETGDVMWSNRVEVEYSPASNSDNENTHRRVMFDKAVHEGIKALMDGFFLEAEGVFSKTSGEIEPVPQEGA